MHIDWQWTDFSKLTVAQWHAVSVLRQSVFIVEQRCPYPDLDALDPPSRHLLGYGETGELLAYLRLVPAGLKYAEPSLGRIVVAPAGRSGGAGLALVQEGLAGHQRLFPGRANTIGAQVYLQRFYTRLGFVNIGEPYLEDDIPHIDMQWNPR